MISKTRSFRVEDGVVIEEVLSSAPPDAIVPTSRSSHNNNSVTTTGSGGGSGGVVHVVAADKNNETTITSTAGTTAGTTSTSTSTSATADTTNYNSNDNNKDKTIQSQKNGTQNVQNKLSLDNNSNTNKDDKDNKDSSNNGKRKTPLLLCGMTKLLGNCTRSSTKHQIRNHNYSYSDHDNDNDEYMDIVEQPSPMDIISTAGILEEQQEENKNNENSNQLSSLTSIQVKECTINPFTNKCINAGLYSTCKHSLYNRPKSITELKDIFELNTDSNNQMNKDIHDLSSHSNNNNKANTSSSLSMEDNEFIQQQQQQQVYKEGGLIWYSTIVPNNYNSNYSSSSSSSLKMLRTKDYDAQHSCIKPRRPNLAIVQDDFFNSLVKITILPKETEMMMLMDDNNDNGGDDNNDYKKKMFMRHDGDEYDNGSADNDDDYQVFDKIKVFDVNDDNNKSNNNNNEHNTTPKQYSKWIFSGVLNGFPGLQDLELIKIEYKSTLVPRWRTHWSTNDNSHDVPPTYPKGLMGIIEVKAKLREPGWSAVGWSKESPGYVLYYQSPETRKVPRVLYGTNIIKQLEEERFEQARVTKTRLQPSPKCIKVHMISHRYAMLNEKWKDKISYHSFAFLEWDHGKYCTVVELAFLNGLGGYNGRCNHAVDRDAPITCFFSCLPPEMVKPWKNTLSEIRCIDVQAKNVKEYLSFMATHTGNDKRFLDVRLTFSHAVRLTFCSMEQIVQYLINYIRRGRTYSEIRKNCQTFAADFCAFLAGKKDVQPFHPLNRFEYRNQTHYFMYESSMY